MIRLKAILSKLFLLKILRSCSKFLAILKRLDFQGAVSGFCSPIGREFQGTWVSPRVCFAEALPSRHVQARETAWHGVRLDRSSGFAFGLHSRCRFASIGSMPSIGMVSCLWHESGFVLAFQGWCRGRRMNCIACIGCLLDLAGSWRRQVCLRWKCLLHVVMVLLCFLAVRLRG